MLELLEMKEIIVIDDDPINNFIFKKMIEEVADSVAEELKVIPFEDPVDALRYLKSLLEEERAFPSHIFLDLNMPDFSGWDFLKAFEQLNLHLNPDCQLYVVSSTILKDEIQRVKNISFVKGFIAKPVTIYKFRKIVNGGMP